MHNIFRKHLETLYIFVKIKAMSKVNLKHLSEALNVSVSTVSKALRNSYEISEDTKKRILQLAQEMGYNPNPYAGALRSNKTKTIALLVPELTNNFFIQAISGAESIAQEKDYHILIYNTMDDTAKEEAIAKHLQNGRVDGVIMSLASTTHSYDHLNELIHSGIPIVFFDRICHEIETAKVITDDFASAFIATEHLIQNGCKDIAYLSISENLSIDNKRKQGYLEALNKHDISLPTDRIVKCNGEEKLNFSKIKKLLQGNNRPDGIFASVEKLALTTYYVCRELDVRIPKELKITCFSNLRTAPLLSPSLTTITQPAFEMGVQAATILFKNLEKKRSLIQNENIIIKSELIKRDSTKK
jgi:LacI family transcriptional regulator